MGHTGSTLHAIVGRLLPSYLVHYPVISAAIQSTNALILSGKINIMSSGVISTDWGLFFDMLVERAVVKALYELMLKSQNHLACHNVSYDVERSTLCLQILYLSVVHQEPSLAKRYRLALVARSRCTVRMTARKERGPKGTTNWNAIL